MKLVDSSVISEPVEFIFNLSNVVVIKHFLFFVMKLSNLSRAPCIYLLHYIHDCTHVYMYMVSIKSGHIGGCP